MIKYVGIVDIQIQNWLDAFHFKPCPWFVRGFAKCDCSPSHQMNFMTNCNLKSPTSWEIINNHIVLSIIKHNDFHSWSDHSSSLWNVMCLAKLLEGIFNFNFLVDSVQINLLQSGTRGVIWSLRSSPCAFLLPVTPNKSIQKEKCVGAPDISVKRNLMPVGSLLKILTVKMSTMFPKEWCNFSKWAFLNNLLSVLVQKCKNSGQVAERLKRPCATREDVFVLVTFVFCH